jgi:RimJ/RimL family protein N-acetyltransferase
MLNGESLLEGKTVNLRVVEKEDLPLIVEWANDPEFNGEHEPIMQLSKTDLEKWYVNSGPEEKWFLVEKKDKARIGLVRYDSHAWGTTLGSVLIPSERGKGYCTEAVRMLVDYLFLSKDIVRIQARFNKQNVASMRLLEKAGFTQEGTMRKSSFSRGKWVDMVMTSILREEWKEPKILTETKKK